MGEHTQAPHMMTAKDISLSIFLGRLLTLMCGVYLLGRLAYISSLSSHYGPGWCSRGFPLEFLFAVC
jgi:hypothetical protein